MEAEIFLNQKETTENPTSIYRRIKRNPTFVK